MALRRRTGRGSRRSDLEGPMLSDFKGDPIPPKRQSSPRTVLSKRALLDRSKRSERRLAKWLITHDGPDPRFRSLTTSTGRVGHVTNLQFDALSLHYAGENKNERLPSGLAHYWQKVCAKAKEWGKEPVLRWDASNKNDFLVGGKPLPELHIITAERHAELLRYERQFRSEDVS